MEPSTQVTNRHFLSPTATDAQADNLCMVLKKAKQTRQEALHCQQYSYIPRGEGSEELNSRKVEWQQRGLAQL